MSERPKVVIVGAGFGGLAAAKRLERRRSTSPSSTATTSTPSCPCSTRWPPPDLNPADVGYVVRGLFRREQRRAVPQGRGAVGVDWDRHEVRLPRRGRAVPFDHLVVAAGSTHQLLRGRRGAEHSFPLYSLEDAIRVRNHLLSLFEAADSEPDLVDDGVLNFVVVGGGPTGVEVAGRPGRADRQGPRAGLPRSRRAPGPGGAGRAARPGLLAPFSESSQRYARQHPRPPRGRGARSARRWPGSPRTTWSCRAARSLPTRLVVWAAGVKAGALAGRLGAEQGKGGRITIDGRPLPRRAPRGLRHRGHRRHRRRLRGPAAPTRPGGHAGRGARRRADRWPTSAGRPRTPFHYRDKGTMATIGRRAAVAELPGLAGWPAARAQGVGRLAGVARPPPRVPARCAQPGVGAHQLGVELPDLGPRPPPDPAARGAAPQPEGGARCPTAGPRRRPEAAGTPGSAPAAEAED